MHGWRFVLHILILVALGLTSLTTVTAEPLVYYDHAEVIDVTPIVSIERTATPHRECQTEPLYRDAVIDRRDNYPQHQRRRASPLPGLFGGLVGGAIGNRFGKGDGKKAMTVIGAIAGASIASNATHRQHRRRQESVYATADGFREAGRVRESRRTHCKVTQRISETEHVQGYHVTYRYLGEQHEKTMQERPGDNIRIRVEMTPEIDTYFPGRTMK